MGTPHTCLPLAGSTNVLATVNGWYPTGFSLYLLINCSMLGFLLSLGRETCLAMAGGGLGVGEGSLYSDLGVIDTVCDKCEIWFLLHLLNLVLLYSILLILCIHSILCIPLATLLVYCIVRTWWIRVTVIFSFDIVWGFWSWLSIITPSSWRASSFYFLLLCKVSFYFLLASKWLIIIHKNNL